MKTDLVEIFQTIRAEMQPYTTMGFNARVNTDTAFDLWKEPGFVEGKETEEKYFAGVAIEKGYVDFYFETSLQIVNLDEVLLQQISDSLAAGFKLYKEKGWV
ncbi:hypothetical protein WG904_13715 [Pedobacter sp. Du54]|uniref:hypothetical protein n=1 Tax=Pedobacter anseongensis TaxID=3133439 RepID=UPI0030A56BAD